MNLTDKKILIVRLGAIGDVIRTLPALRSLRANLPKAHLAWVVEDRAASLLINHPDLDNVFVIPRKEWQQKPLSIATVKSVKAFFQNLRKNRFDYVLDFHSLFKSGVVTYFSGGKIRIGYSRPFCKEGSSLFTNQHVSLPPHKINRVERNLLLVKSLGLDIDEHDPIIPLCAEDEALAENIVRSQCKDDSQLKVIIHPGSSPQTPYKRWDYRRYAQLADVLVQRFKAKIFFTAGKDEQSLVQDILKIMVSTDHVVCKTATLTQLAAVLGKCDLYIGSDTAPMHLAAFMGTSVVALFGPTDTTENAPLGKGRSIIVKKDVPCNPCRNRTCGNLLCMDAVTVDDVVAAVEKILGKTANRNKHRTSNAV